MFINLHRPIPMCYSSRALGRSAILPAHCRRQRRRRCVSCPLDQFWATLHASLLMGDWDEVIHAMADHLHLEDVHPVILLVEWWSSYAISQCSSGWSAHCVHFWPAWWTSTAKAHY